MTWTKQQTVSGNNGAAATTSVAATLAGTLYNSLLVAAVTCAVNGASITPPAGWQQIGTIAATNPAGGSVALFRYENNPGGITTVTFTITSSLAAVVISEYIPSPIILSVLLDQFINGTFANGTTAFSGFTPPLKEFSELVVIGIGFVATALGTVSGINSGFTQDGSSITTAGSGNACVFLYSNLSLQNLSASGQPIALTQVTLSATPTNGPSVNLATFIGFLVRPNNSYIGPTNDLLGVFQ